MTQQTLLIGDKESHGIKVVNQATIVDGEIQWRQPPSPHDIQVIQDVLKSIPQPCQDTPNDQTSQT